MEKKLSILGTRGIPARHGGFETFAERLAIYLVERGWDVTVYCQRDTAMVPQETEWRGVRLHNLRVGQSGAAGTILFDWRATLHALRQRNVVLTLGYNTAIFNLLLMIGRVPNVINMDGLEWQRSKWNALQKSWLYVNERVACWVADGLIADHPRIADHLRTRVDDAKITMIPYGADRVTESGQEILSQLELAPRSYSLVVARPEPENSILEIVEAFSAHPRGEKLVVLGEYLPQSNRYHRHVLDVASSEVLFPGAIYDSESVAALRKFNRIYLHGHSVGGTNPSLVEALAAGSPVIAHDNPFNRWVAGNGARYFQNSAECCDLLDKLLSDQPELDLMSAASQSRYEHRFQWDQVLKEYELLLTALLDRRPK